MGYQQAAIKIENKKEFEELKGAMDRVFRPEAVEKFLKQVRSKGARVRDVEKVIRGRVLEQADEVLAKSGTSAQRLYDGLTVSDQAQMREYYLSKIEEVDPAMRAKFHKLYQYY